MSTARPLHTEATFEREVCEHLVQAGWLHAAGDAAGDRAGDEGIARDGTRCKHRR